MTSIKDIIEKIDVSKMERNHVEFYSMCGSEFEIYEYLYQSEDLPKLTYCYYHRWICTDTEVGIRIWYFENKPVCISYKPYRKSDETFGWLSKNDFEKVRTYAISLQDVVSDINIIDDKTILDVVNKFKSIDHKPCERLNIKQSNENNKKRFKAIKERD